MLRQPHLLAPYFPIGAKRAIRNLIARLDSNRECMWPNCHRKPRDSHVISETFLSLIAQDDKVKGPRNAEVSVIHPVDLVKFWPTKSATTFLGYCDDHEKKFAVFENYPPGRVATIQHMRLQLCRTVASELQDRRDLVHLLTRLRREFGAEFKRHNLATTLRKTRDHLAQAEQLLGNLHEDLKAGEEESEGRVPVRPFFYPADFDVALTYLDFIAPVVPSRSTNLNQETPLAVAVFPQRPSEGASTETLFLLASLDREVLDAYVATYVTPVSPQRLMGLCEQWMRKGCFSWWTRPTWWDNLGDLREAITRDALTFS